MPNHIPETAYWRGKPSTQRIRQLKAKYFYDQDNELRGGYGVLYGPYGKVEFDVSGVEVRPTGKINLEPTCPLVT